MCVGTTVAEVAAGRRTCWPVVIVVRRPRGPVVAVLVTLTAIAGSGRRGHW